MSEQDGPPSDSTPPRIPDSPPTQPPVTPSGTDRSGWSQPPAPQSPGPPGAGSPVQPGPPLSVQAPIKDTTINMAALLLGVGAVVLVIIVVLLLIVAFAHH